MLTIKMKALMMILLTTCVKVMIIMVITTLIRKYDKKKCISVTTTNAKTLLFSTNDVCRFKYLRKHHVIVVCVIGANIKPIHASSFDENEMSLTNESSDGLHYMTMQM